MIIGVIQGAVGASTLIFAYFFYYNLFGLQTLLDLQQSGALYLFLLLIFGLFSIFSGIALVQEWLESR